MIKYEKRITTVIVVPTDESIFNEMATTISIVDEEGGEYVSVSQNGPMDIGQIAIDVERWPVMREAIDQMITECRLDNIHEKP